MRRRGDTCAPVRAAPVQLRVANGMRVATRRSQVPRGAHPASQKQKLNPCWAGGLAGWGAEPARTGSAFRFKEPYFWEGTGNCQSAREGAHRRRVMSADQLLDNKEGVLQEKVAAAAATAAPRSLAGKGASGRREEGRRLPGQLKAKELKGL
ncbi:unnamed protein product [Rangifer tarandus platyrhynchus]|uniref:Uncharacterized protein n=1 Tax=Rangifer tarandus platyrhynchus TaxID=3082113 RepID=A0AC59YGE0_RANTA